MHHNTDQTAGQARPPKPSPLPVIPEHIPAELAALNQWLIWRYFYKTDLGYWDKPPLDANKSGNAGKSTDPKTWATFEKALSSYHLGNLDGIGVALIEKNGVVGFDLDSCRDPETGEIAPWALKIVEQVRTYWEISTSGTGLRGFGYGRKPGSRCRSADFEMYVSGRYLCITGHHLEGTPPTLEAVQDGIDTVYAEMFPTKEMHASSNGASPTNNDEAILQHARAARNAAKFCTLFDDGDISSYEDDHSRADLALCRLIAFYTQEREQVDRLFRISALHRQKWENRADYRDWTITKAIETARDHWRSVSAETNGQPQDERNASSNGDEQDIPQGEVTLEKVIETFREWLDLPDAGFIEVLLATYAANQIPGDPVWLLAVGPSSGGKTEPLQAMLSLPHTRLASTLTESALLSGTPKREKDKSSTGGLLREIGDFGYLILKDFTSVLAMQDKIRMTTVAALREIYDQSWARPLGIDGGRVLSWSGKVAIMAGCTDVIDSHHTLMTAMGSRFLMYRIPLIDAYAQAAKAYDMNARELEMRQQLKRVITGFLKGRDFSAVRPTTSEAIRERLIQLSILAVVARSPIERDRHTREITLIPDPEAPARVTKALGKLHAALGAIGVSKTRAWTLVRKIAFDSMPKLRYAIIMALAKNSSQPASKIAVAIHHPTQTTKRALEDLVGLKLVEREKIQGIRADLWSLTDETSIRLQQLPEIVENEDSDEL